MAGSLILFAATAHALRAEKLARRSGIEAKLVPVPRHLSSDCGLALITACPVEQAARLFEGLGVPIEAVHPAP